MYALYIRGVSKGNINHSGEVIKDEVENVNDAYLYDAIDSC